MSFGQTAPLSVKTLEIKAESFPTCYTHDTKNGHQQQITARIVVVVVLIY